MANWWHFGLEERPMDVNNLTYQQGSWGSERSTPNMCQRQDSIYLWISYSFCSCHIPSHPQPHKTQNTLLSLCLIQRLTGFTEKFHIHYLPDCIDKVLDHHDIQNEWFPSISLLSLLLLGNVPGLTLLVPPPPSSLTPPGWLARPLRLWATLLPKPLKQSGWCPLTEGCLTLSRSLGCSTTSWEAGESPGGPMEWRSPRGMACGPFVWAGHPPWVFPWDRTSEAKDLPFSNS